MKVRFESGKRIPDLITITLQSKLRLAALLVLLTGFIGAGLVVWLVPLPPDFTADPATAGIFRPQRHEMERLYGPTGAMIIDFFDALKQPSTLAMLLLAGSFLCSGILFYLAGTLSKNKGH